MNGEAIFVRSFARIHETNLKKQGVLPLVFADPATYGEIREDDRISILGYVDDLPAVMAALDVALYPALESDGMSRVLFEYLAAGVPVVASRVGVVPEILEDGRTARLVPPGEAAPLAEAIAGLLDDAARRAEIGAAGAALVRARYSGARLAERLTALYLSLGVGEVPPSS